MARVWVVIPARGGSKGIKGKNLRTVGGIPLVVRAIQSVLGAFLTHFGKDASRRGHFIESTGELRLDQGLPIVSSDSTEIRRVALLHGAAAMKRSKVLALDAAPTDMVLTEVVGTLAEATPFQEDDVLMCVQCTVPFTTPDDVLATYRALLADPLANSAMTVRRFTRFVWQPVPGLSTCRKHVRLLNPLTVGGRPRRQDFPELWEETGGVYAVRMRPFIASRDRMTGPVVPVEVNRPEAGLDIDCQLDLETANFLADRGGARAHQ